MKDLYSSASLNAISEAVETETTLNNGARVAKPIEQETLLSDKERTLKAIL
jgi:hypothetical protein